MGDETRRVGVQGYVVLACGKQNYYDMAINIARSIRVFDPKRALCLIYDEGVQLGKDAEHLFDDLVFMAKSRDYVGVMNKVRVFEFSPYEQTMYLDADMLLFKPNIDAYWQALNGQFFNMTGGKTTKGVWYGKTIPDLIEAFNIPYIVRMNSGVFYFEKNQRGFDFFERVKILMTDHKEALSRIHQNVSGQFADEPAFGVAMGEAGIDPMQTIEGQGSWMVTTWQSRNIRFAPETGVSYLQRSTGYPFRLSWLSRGWVDHSPNFVHFISLKPKSVYTDATAWFQARLASGRDAM